MSRLQMRIAVLLPFATVIAAMAGCHSTSNPPPTAASPPSTTESFSGTIGQSGSAGYPFTVSSTGPVQIGLTSVAPLSTMALGVAVTSGGSPCGSTIVQNDNARTGATALSGITVAGSYCVQVYDSGNIPDATTVSYTVQVIHP